MNPVLNTVEDNIERLIEENNVRPLSTADKRELLILLHTLVEEVKEMDERLEKAESACKAKAR